MVHSLRGEDGRGYFQRFYTTNSHFYNNGCCKYSRIINYISIKA